MAKIRSFVVTPNLPDRLKSVEEIARNLWWSWDAEAVQMFIRMDRDIWYETPNPVQLLGTISQKRLKDLSEDESFLAHLDRVYDRFRRYMSNGGWFHSSNEWPEEAKIAYFCAEFGLDHTIPIYSGGLGILSGDSLKSVSDLGLPLVAVGLLYRQGFFRQYLNADGWQQEYYPENDFFNLPISPVTKHDGTPLKIQVALPGRDLYAQVWKLQVGRIPLYLLDANVLENTPEDREVTAQLYGGDRDMRLRQEILLGIGGMRTLRALEIDVAACHINEGHSAFLILERARQIMVDNNLAFQEAAEAVRGGCIFTTHTPVPAGNEVFPTALMDKYFRNYWPQLGLERDQFFALGRMDPKNTSEGFGMTVFALRFSDGRNGVSKLHGEVSRKMWKDLWTDVPDDEIPIHSITNGVHINTWISLDLDSLYDRYLGPSWKEKPADHSVWRRVAEIPDPELWRTHERRRERLVVVARARLRRQLLQRGASRVEVEAAEEVLDPEALTIGFARRFATYKRGDLLFRDVDRLEQIVSNSERPVQIIYAGKAHPADSGGKEIIRRIVHLIRKDSFRRRIVFLEDYDIHLARYLVQGVDIWLNTPRRPMEASGTSGMKAAANGAINMSVPDGWWCEGFEPGNGWNIGKGEDYADHEYQDSVESTAIYDLLEKEIVPTFYNRGSDGVPRDWVRMMKNTIRTNCPRFNTNRMIMEYCNRLYLPAQKRFALLSAGGFAESKNLTKWRDGMRQAWTSIEVGKVEAEETEEIYVGEDLNVDALIGLGNIKPDDVTVEIYCGPLNSKGEITSPERVPMECLGPAEDSKYRFRGAIPCRMTGRYGYSLRILPKNQNLADPYVPGLILWG